MLKRGNGDNKIVMPGLDDIIVYRANYALYSRLDVILFCVFRKYVDRFGQYVDAVDLAVLSHKPLSNGNAIAPDTAAEIKYCYILL